jgi:hypothetical protein
MTAGSDVIAQIPAKIVGQIREILAGDERSVVEVNQAVVINADQIKPLPFVEYNTRPYVLAD